jgi:hypothetical protein
MFVNTDPIPIIATGETTRDALAPETEVIFIRPKMDFETRQLCGDELNRIHAASGAPINAASLGAYNIALMRSNIVAWQGGQFTGVPCTAKNIGLLDFDEPIVGAVLDAIKERNPMRRKEAPVPKAEPAPARATSSGPTSAGESSSAARPARGRRREAAGALTSS